MNAYLEIVDHWTLEGLPPLSELFAGAQVRYDTSWDPTDWNIFTEDQYEEFKNWMSFNYDAGYGSQHLFGFVLLNNDTWFERHESVVRSERWVLRKRPVLDPTRKKYLDC